MSDIAKLYEEVMAGAETEKVAHDMNADDGVAFDGEFFAKVASGDEESIEALNSFIEEARAEGYSDDDIESAIETAMTDEGVKVAENGEEADDEEQFEIQKAAAYEAGSLKALEDVLDSDMAKQAGVTLQDLIDYELGGHYGEGYAETRQILDSAVEKIAAKKGPGLLKRIHKSIGKAVGASKGAGEKTHQMYSGIMGEADRIGGARGKEIKRQTQAAFDDALKKDIAKSKSRRATAIMAGVPAAAAAGGVAAGRASKSDD